MAIIVDEEIYSQFGQFTFAESEARKKLNQVHRRYGSMPSIKQHIKQNQPSKLVNETFFEEPAQGECEKPTESPTTTEPKLDRFEALRKTCTRELKISPDTLTVLFNLVITGFHIKKLTSVGMFSVLFISSFSHLVYTMVTLYYISFLVCSFKKRSLLKPLIAFGNIAVNGALGMNIWLVNSSDRPDALLSRFINSNVHVPNFIYLGNQVTLWQPVILWIAFQIINRNIINLLTWEYEGLIINPKLQRLFRAYYTLSPTISLFIWYIIKRFLLIIWTLASETDTNSGSFMLATDLPELPSKFIVLCYSFLVNIPLLMWSGFQTFQYRGIVWKIPSTLGILVFQQGEESLLYEVS